jgi:hypothetical protein
VVAGGVGGRGAKEKGTCADTHPFFLFSLSFCPCPGTHTPPHLSISLLLPLFRPTHTHIHTHFLHLCPCLNPHTHIHTHIFSISVLVSTHTHTHHLKIVVTIWKFPRDHTSNYQFNHHMKKLITFRITTHTPPEKNNHL